MTSTVVRVSRTLVLLLILFGASAITSAQTPQKTFYPAGDAASEISAALKAARNDGKHVLLDFGADWCPDCRVLGALFEDPSIAPAVAANFHVVRVDVGRRDKNGDLAGKYHATSADWIPALVVLSPDGSTVAVTNETVRVTRRTTAAELGALLKSWAPKERRESLGEFTERGVRVSLGLDVDRSGAFWLAATFTPLEPSTHLYSIDLPANGVDGLGRPTRVSLASGSVLRATGHLVADRAPIADRIDALGVSLPVYPAGAVTARLPVVKSRRSDGRADVLVSYMACGPRGCLAPVTDRRVILKIR